MEIGRIGKTGSDSIYKSHIFLYIDNKEVDPWISADNNPCGIIENGGKRNVMLMITESMLKQVEIPVDIDILELMKRVKIIYRKNDEDTIFSAYKISNVKFVKNDTVCIVFPFRQIRVDSSMIAFK